MAKSKEFWLTEKILAGVALSTEKPRQWFSINQSSGFRETRYFSIEKHTKNDMISYGVCIGPLWFKVGWLKK